MWSCSALQLTATLPGPDRNLPRSSPPHSILARQAAPLPSRLQFRRARETHANAMTSLSLSEQERRDAGSAWTGRQEGPLARAVSAVAALLLAAAATDVPRGRRSPRARAEAQAPLSRCCLLGLQQAPRPRATAGHELPGLYCVVGRSIIGGLGRILMSLSLVLPNLYVAYIWS